MIVLVHHSLSLGPEVDPQRPLSSAGLAQAAALAERLRDAGIAPAAIWHSGKLRARQTAEALLRVCGPFADFRMVRGLRPDDPPEGIRDELVAETRDVLAVGHMPQIARLAALLCPGAEMPAHGAVILTPDAAGYRARVVTSST